MRHSEPVAERASTDLGVEGAAPPEGLSAFAARVLNQLSLGAWLPGGFLVAVVGLITWFHGKNRVTLAGADVVVKDSALALAVLAVPTLVVATLVTQAFSFEAIRVLEGYWPAAGPFSGLFRLGVWLQERRRGRLQRRLQRIQLGALNGLEPQLLSSGVPGMVVLALKADVQMVARPRDLSAADSRVADSFDWTPRLRPAVAAEIGRLARLIDGFPEPHRMMPTRLGIVLRTAEDDLRHGDGDVEGFMLRNRQHAPERLVVLHDLFRTRLEMYTNPVLVALVTASASIPVLGDIPAFAWVGVTGSLGAIGILSYRAAIASAKGYTSALLAIDRSLDGAA